MQPKTHAAARCQNRENCTGPGCRVRTGKTRRKAGGWGRPFGKHLTPAGEE